MKITKRILCDAAGRITGVVEEPPDAPAAPIVTVPTVSAETRLLAGDRGLIAPASGEHRTGRGALMLELVALLHSTGSFRKPKWLCVSHRGLAAATKWALRRLGAGVL
jgi:hypothetical protein